ncbi:uncharacterized protein CHSO_2194 [Chryseobacterium sp. StRB126]|uniref:hypothetical protein n=1 Tax=Chryseobacterium sp. StRB126 TaxID=878220 RepID=UPI0004E99ED9|nr:hypothetical protein [Chryseobacterium sp. StRB126]BAP31231.1 uncharacterized protein CHSO_2194 [Chryseobacterium sp. StRB126]
MKKNIILLGTLLISGFALSQVGVNTATPQATFDIVGASTNTAKTDGLIAPRLKGSELKAKDALYTAAQTGAIVYVTEALASTGTTTKTANVTTVGYFYFDGSAWQKIAYGSFTEADGVIGNEVLNATTNGGLTRTGSGTVANPYTLGLTTGTVNGQVMTWNGTTWNPANPLNIYNADGTLTGIRTLTQNGNNLSFQGVQRTQFENSAGIGIQQDSGTGTRSSIGLSNGGAYQLWIYTDKNNAAQISASGNSTSLVIGTGSTSNPSGIDFNTCSGGGTTGSQRAEIDGNGRFNINNTLSVGYSSQQTFTGTQKLKVNGSIVTTGGTYPDYVFEDYYNKNSAIKPTYKFTSLYDTEKFIRENRHLPGVTSIRELEKTKDGYSFNISDLSVQSLEKIEELYLYTIEQQKQIDEQKSQITLLLTITEKLKSEVEFLKKQ